MPHVDIFREPVYRTFRSSECSWAAFYMKLVNVFRYFLPILIIFVTDGLWRKTNTFREVPDISLTGDFIVYAYGHDRSIVSSSFAVLNSAASSDQLSTSQITHHFSNPTDFGEEEDNGFDDDVQILNLNLQFQMSTQNLSIDTLIYAFVLKFRLDYHSVIDMELLLTDTLKLPPSTSTIQTTARLSVDQSIPFHNSKQTFQIIDRSRQDVEHFQIQSVLRRVTQSPITLEMKR
uniref:Transmembrane protein 231 n=1 Tax=Caenorhabditis japonica TaxID=281687 RepID=A0A8R1HH88_CAEJA